MMNSYLSDTNISLELENFKLTNLDKYIRIKLGQKKFPTPASRECLDNNNDGYCNNCKNCKHNQDYFTWKQNGHLRFDFNANKFIKNNLKIIELFNDLYGNIKVVIHSHEGFIEAYFIKINDFMKYDYWNETSYNNMKFPYIACIDLTGLGTIEIIKTIIERIEKINNGCKLPENCEYKNHNLCDICTICKIGIIPSLFNFRIKKISFFNHMFPKNTKIIEINQNEIVVDCKANFNEEQKNIINLYNIRKLEDLMENRFIKQKDKLDFLKYYKYIYENYKLNGFEVLNIFMDVQFDDYMINLLVLHDGTIKYCNIYSVHEYNNLNHSVL